MGFLVFLIVITVAPYLWLRRMKIKKGVWIKMSDGSEYIGFKKQSVFGTPTCRYGKHILQALFDPYSCELSHDGQIGKITEKFNYGVKPVQWKSYN